MLDEIFKEVPAGVGKGGITKLSREVLKDILEKGAEWAVQEGYGFKEDIERTEEYGRMRQALASAVSERALSRGLPQLGTLGAGNHFLEFQKVDRIFDEKAAERFGITEPGQITVMVHCLPGNSKILTEYGYHINIEKMENKWKEVSIKCMDINTHELVDTTINKFFKIKPYGKIFRLTTQTGRNIIATEDHPLLTPNGLRLISEINKGDKVAVLPFEGVEYEEPLTEIIISEEDIIKIENNERIINKLKKKGFLPLRYNSNQLPILTKLLGYLTGDGWLGKNKDRWSLKFIGDIEDLKNIKKDISRLGYKASGPYRCDSKSEITYSDGKKRVIDGSSYQIVVTSLALPILFYALGAPFGSKSRNEFDVPRWVFKAPLWIKRLYLAGYFGAEMTKPNIRKKEKYRFGNPTISMNKIENLKDNGKNFLLQIGDLLKEFGIPFIKITEHKGVINKIGEKTIKLRLKLSSKEGNLRKLWSKIGFEYCNKRTNLSSYTSQYLNLKKEILKEEAIKVNKPETKLAITSFKFRIAECPTFEDFKGIYKLNPATPVIWDAVIRKEEIYDFDDYVYDFRVNHKDHNFVANGFINGNCGSRGLGHQVASDYIKLMEDKYGFKDLPDRELINAPIQSELGKKYFAAMAAAANYAFANKQMITHWVRDVFEKVMGSSENMKVVYDVCHNIAKIEEHVVDGEKKSLCVHRKGATRSFGPGREEIPEAYRDLGQPIIIPGSMGTASYVLLGTKKAEELSFASTAHGAGRVASRAEALRSVRGEQVVRELAQKGIEIKGASWKGIAEESPQFYKDIDEVVRVSHELGIGKLVVRVVPIGVMKG